MSLIEVKDLSAGYGDLTIVRNVSLCINSDEIVVLLGSNGAGKTTLIEALVGLNPVKEGTVSFSGKRLEGKSAFAIAKEGVSLVPQGRGLFGGMSVLENLLLGSYLPLPRRKRAQSLEYVYALFPKLKERNHQKAGSLSGGEQQMLTIGRAIMSDPKLLILDEPSLGLAPLVVGMIFRSIVEIQREKKIAVLLVEQNLKKALSVANRGYVLESGKIVIEGQPEELASNDHVKRAYLGA
jgi:branched-chain amino acid transport system ATP-binding protein